MSFKHTIKNHPVDIVSSRHPALVEWLRERNHIGSDVPVLEHVTAADVRGRHVIGVLPHWLSCQCAVYSEVPMRVTQADREAMQAGDLPIERVREVAAEPVDYVVLEGVDPWALAAYRAIHWVTQEAGSRPVVYSPEPGRVLVEAGDPGCPVVAEIDAYGARWRKLGYDGGPWLDAVTGRELPDYPEPSSIERAVCCLRSHSTGNMGGMTGAKAWREVSLRDGRTLTIEVDSISATVRATETTIVTKEIGEGAHIGPHVVGLLVSRRIGAVEWSGPVDELNDTLDKIVAMTADRIA